MQTQNPYAAGEAIPASPPVQYAGELASKKRRLGTFLVDYAVYYLLCAVVAIVVILVMGDHALDGNRGYLISIPMFLVYYATFEGAIGRTPGKLVFGTRVVNAAGGDASFSQVVGRTLSRFIPFEPLSVLFATDGEAMGWHDSIARTKVIRSK
ncbi:RDD family protein [Lysobacter xanthus]